VRNVEPLLLKRISLPGSETLAVYLREGGYRALRKALERTPDQVLEEVKRSGLRGRGGAGFPTGMKWGFTAKDPKKPKYLLCNADEGEPGTFKDRPLLEKDPHALIEGMVISAFAIGAEFGYIYLRAEYPYAAKVLERALAEAYEQGFLGKNILGKGVRFDLYLHVGAGAYICGEETALIESIEGKRGEPRIKPPFPANVGVFGMPTVVNNVETLVCVPLIIERGADWFAAIGPKESPGPKIFSLSGHVVRPGNYELPMGTPLRTLIYECGGGIPQGRRLKAVIPGGPSTPVLTEAHLDVGLDFGAIQAAGSMLGCGAVIVMDETTCMVRVAHRLLKFFHHESCGKCTPCREGTGWLEQILGRIEGGRGRMEDLDLLLDASDNIRGKTVCALADGAVSPVTGTLKYFREEYEAHIRQGRCPFQLSTSNAQLKKGIAKEHPRNSPPLAGGD
jgi:NADH-quinone oxidoreductase subunit F